MHGQVSVKTLIPHPAIAGYVDGSLPDGVRLDTMTKPRKNRAAVALARLGASKGGRARAAKLTPERRREIARQAVIARWKKTKRRSERG
jgi:hypothetical protein